MGNLASRLSCLGERRSRLGSGPRARRGTSLPIAPQGHLPPEVSWAWWCPPAIQVTEVTETVVTETVVTEAVEVGPGWQGGQSAQVPPAPLDSLQSWLDGMEELQASQGPLAADATVAAAQLREQKLLQRVLGERAPQVELQLRAVGSPAELRTQWHRVVQQAEARWGVLERLVPAAQSFEAAREALLEWLSPGEQLLAEVWQGQLGPGGQAGAMQGLQHVCKGAAACAKDLERALETGRRLGELLAEDEARLVGQQLEQLQERVRLVMSSAACARQKVLCAQRTGSPEPLPPAGLEAQLDLEGAASECPGLRDQEQLSVQLTQLAERLELLAWRAEAPGQAAALTVPSQGQWLPPGALAETAYSQNQEVEPPEGCWAEAGEQDSGLKATWGRAQQIWCGLAEQAATKEGLQPEGSWDPASQQEFPRGEQILVVSWLWKGPALRGGATCEDTCHPGLWMELLSYPSRERPHSLEGTPLLMGHLREELLACPHRLGQVKALGPKVGPVVRDSSLHGDLVDEPRGWGPEELPGALGAAGLKCWAGAPGAVLALRGPDHTWSRALARLLGESPEDLSWRPPWAEATMGSQIHRKLDPRERSQGDKDQWVQLEQDLTDTALESGEQGRDGQGWPRCTWRKPGPTPELDTALGSGLPSGQRLPHNTVRVGDTEGLNTRVSRGGSKPQGGLVARGTLMVRVGGGWVALDEFLVKNDPGRAKGRTSHKIHERFLHWVGAPVRPPAEVITLRLWASIPGPPADLCLRRHTETPALTRARPGRFLKDSWTQQTLDRKRHPGPASGD